MAKNTIFFLQKGIMDFIYMVIFEFLLHKQTAIWEYVTKAASRLVGNSNSIIPSNKMCQSALLIFSLHPSHLR